MANLNKLFAVVKLKVLARTRDEEQESCTNLCKHEHNRLLVVTLLHGVARRCYALLGGEWCCNVCLSVAMDEWLNE